MSKIDCDIIKDLLPLYAEDMVSAKSREAVDEHLAECEGCRHELGLLTGQVPVKYHPEQADGLKAFRSKMKKHTATIVTMSVFATIWAIILLWGLFFLKPGDEMGYCILTLYLILPVTSFVCSMIAGVQKNRIKWLVPLIFGAAGCLLPFAIFGTWDWFGLFFAGVPSVVGLLIGALVKKLIA